MMKFAVLLALVAYASAAVLPKIVEDDVQVAAELAALNPVARIIGGSPTTIDKVPYLVSLRQYNTHICGASIITDRWVITSASCVNGGSGSAYSMRTGSTFSNSEGEIFSFGRIIPHRSYGKTTYGIPRNDIAVLRLSVRQTIPFDSTRRVIPLFESGEVVTPGTEAVVSGWGPNRELGPPFVTTLKSTSVEILSSIVCERGYASWSSYGGLFQPDQFCAGSVKGDRDMCGSDTGGPLVIDGRLAGIASWGRGCGSTEYPSVYTKVAAHKEWINWAVNFYNRLP